MRRLVLLGLLLFAGCAATVPPLPSYAAAPAPSSKPRLWYVGLGLYDESWSEGDVVAAAEALAAGAHGFEVVPDVLSNRSPRQYRPASPDAIGAKMGEIGQRAGPGDVVLVYVSTHGAPGRLGRAIGGREKRPITVEDVRSWLAPIQGRDTIVVLSACFSGSFIPGLRDEHRIVLAAARADRTSFGCRAGADHTVFGSAFLDALATPRTSLHEIVDKVRETVSAREHEMGVRQRSEPQLFVGDETTRLFDAPVF